MTRHDHEAFTSTTETVHWVISSFLVPVRLVQNFEGLSNGGPFLDLPCLFHQLGVASYVSTTKP
jgi:hypothetical protein